MKYPFGVAYGEAKGPGRGWWGPPHGTHGQGESDVGVPPAEGNAKVITSTMAADLEKIYDEWESEMGYGPCGVYSVVKREEGLGQIATCIAKTGDMVHGFTHYVIWNNGVIDMSNPFGEPLTYSEIDVLGSNEMPELVTRADVSRMKDMLKAAK